MFEAAELGSKISKEEFERREPSVHQELLELQRRVRDADFPVIVIVSGVEGAGKGDVVSLLHRWMDVRGLETQAFWDETDEERLRPRYWRFWRAMPPKGRIGILFGSWYTRPIIDLALKFSKRDKFDRELERIRHFEDMLVDDGALIIKLWFHLSKKGQLKRLEEDAKGKGVKVGPLTKTYAKSYDRFVKVSERALRKTDVSHSPWHIIDASNTRFRDMRVGEILIERLKARLDEAPPSSGRVTVSSPALLKAGEQSVLSAVPLAATVDDKAYRRAMEQYSDELYDLAWKARAKGVNTVAVFEGWDAAGKGGAIRRVTQAMDARLYRVISVAAPTDEEKAHHYLWRFWRHVPRRGFHTIYDRSWYGRVLVERVEGFATDLAWQRAYNEINSFEEQLVDHGTLVLKFWVHIDQQEQLRRFREREQTPWKQHKITAEDWRNRDRWDDYERAVTDMVVHTSTEIAPWTLVPGNDKRVARVEILKTYCERLAAALD
ncbi:MAG: polyphosphate:AMP phosphotransferase [Proteobacteria bacterium]|nr:polyphosphate:AMP phosphotransferase [Pseudomonadota bacterium]